MAGLGLNPQDPTFSGGEKGCSRGSTVVQGTKPVVGAGQRRNRKTSSIEEDKDLVEGVEMLGMGRWNDIKGIFFLNAQHLTSRDLKNMWKTLVLKAEKGPTDIRAPGELLNKVLIINAYGSGQKLGYSFIDRPKA